MPRPGLDRVDFERLMREAYRLVYQIAYSALGNGADAEEVTQDAFLIAYEKIGSLRDPEKFRPWVARAGWQLALNRRRGTAPGWRTARFRKTRRRTPRNASSKRGCGRGGSLGRSLLLGRRTRQTSGLGISLRGG